MRSEVFIAAMVIATASAAGAEPLAERKAVLRAMVEQDCGSCHGMTRKGGLGSPLLPEILAGLPPEGLVETILEGRPGTPMPPWKTMLSRDDAIWIVAYLLGETR